MKLARTIRSQEVREFLLNGIKTNQENVAHAAMERFGLTRQAIHAHFAALVEDGFLASSGSTKARVYQLGSRRFHDGVYLLKGLEESEVYFSDFGAIFNDLPKEVANICHYGFTEMLNNAIDHSEGQQVYIHAERTPDFVSITILDDGEGIFNHIARLLGLHDPRESILELSKGKLTTDPSNHSGQGIFFSSRAFDEYFIFSRDLVFSHTDGSALDFLLHSEKSHKGTRVQMKIALNSDRTLRSVFDAYSGTEDEDYAFNKTVVPVKLALYEGGQLVSRSQAKRILNRVDRFKTVLLDFKGVESIGQAFADEVFRVFARRNPQIEIHPFNESLDVKKMIRAAQSEGLGNATMKLGANE
jgi:anti-sigma regulatory factor (Ser/Thr protein kinase)